MEIALFSDIVESNGKTIRQNNLELQHNIPVGTLVEDSSTGIRAFVALHTRDCDGTPLYSLTIHEIREEYDYTEEPGIVGLLSRTQLLNGFPESSLVVVKK